MVAATLLLAPAPALAAPPPPFRDPALPLAARIDDLLSRLTADEKISLLHQYEPAIPRLGIGVFKTGTEALHGVAWSTDYDNNGAVVTANGTVFPQAVGLAITWDPALIKQVGTAVGQEARGFNAREPDAVGPEPVGAGGQPAARPAVGPQRGGLLRGPVPHRRARDRVRPRHPGRRPALPAGRADAEALPRLQQRGQPRHEQLLGAAEDPARLRRAGVQDPAAGRRGQRRDAVVQPGQRPAEHGQPGPGSLLRKWAPQDIAVVTDAGAPYNLVDSENYYATQAEADAAAIKAGIDSFTDNNTNGSITVEAVKDALAEGC